MAQDKTRAPELWRNRKSRERAEVRHVYGTHAAHAVLIFTARARIHSRCETYGTKGEAREALDRAGFERATR